MGFFRRLLGYGLIYHAAKSGAQKGIEKQARKFTELRGSVPFETTVKLRVPVDDDTDPKDLEELLSSIEIDVPPYVSIDTVDISASLEDEDGDNCGPQTYPPNRSRHFSFLSTSKVTGMSRSAKRYFRDVERQKRAEDKKRWEEDRLRTMRDLEEMDAFLKNHSPEEYEQWLLERNQQ